MSTVLAMARASARRVFVDVPTALAVASRVVQLVASPVTLLLMARAFDPEMQGYYFTFGSLLALQSVVELGLSIVITNVSSHEWAHLAVDADGAVVGDPAARTRLHSLIGLVTRWYAVAALLFLAAVSAGGAMFLSRSPSAAHVGWVGPWAAVVSLSALALWLTPFYAILDGCNQFVTTNRFRLAQAVLVPLASWTTILLGGGLWTAVAAVGASVSVSLVLFGVRYRRFFQSLAAAPGEVRMSWAEEIWPMQWRLAVSAVASFLTVSLYNPVMFASQGAAAAGRMGMTMAAVRALQMLGQSWIDTQVSHFGSLIARRDFDGLNAVFRRRTAATLAVVAGGGAAFLLLVVGLRWLHHPLAQRMLDPLSTVVLLVGAVLGQLSSAMSAYLRAHKQEPVMVLSVVTSVSIGAAVWLLGSRYGALGAACGSTAVWVANVLWVSHIWMRCRREWHEVPEP